MPTQETILAVDDEPLILSAYQRNLGDRYNILTAEGPELAADPQANQLIEAGRHAKRARDVEGGIEHRLRREERVVETTDRADGEAIAEREVIADARQAGEAYRTFDEAARLRDIRG